MFFRHSFSAGAQKAALKYFHDIESRRGNEKLWGVFEHKIKSDRTGILPWLPR